MNNPFFIGLILFSLLMIPMLFKISYILSSKKILIFCRTYILSLLVYITLFFSGSLVDVFGDEYSYQNVPSPIKEQIDFFLKEAEKRGVDTSRIKDLKITYLSWKYSPALYAGACNIKKNELSLPQKDIDMTIIFHELGHCILQYEHYLDSKYDHEIMYYESSSKQSLSKESLDSFFYNSPKSKILAKSVEFSFKLLLSPFSLISAIFLVYLLFTSFSHIYKVIIKKN